MIKLVSYNMHKGVGLDRRRDPRRILDVLREIDGDVIALQEADRRFGAKERVIPRAMLDETPWRALTIGPTHAIGGGSMGWHGNALLVREGVEARACAALHLPALEPRGAVRADLLIDAIALRVVGMHLDLSGLWRSRQARAVLSHIEGCGAGPTVLMGDLNEWARRGGCLREFERHFSCAPTGPSFHARRPVGRLDRIFVRGLRVVDCGVHASAAARRASDHLPIWAVVEPA